MHSGLQTRWSQPDPVQPSSQRHAPAMHTPCVPQSTEHTSKHGHTQRGGGRRAEVSEGARVARMEVSGLVEPMFELARPHLLIVGSKAHPTL